MSTVALALSWATLLAGLGAFLYVRRHGGGRALEELELANKILERRLVEQAAELRQQAQVIGALEQRTNLEPMVSAVVSQFSDHERRAQERHTEHMRSQRGVLSVLELIADKLGPESEAA